MRPITLVCALLLLISGCAPRIVAQNEKSITIENSKEDQAKAFKMADDYCHSMGKSAVPSALHINNQQIMGCMESFECK